MLCKQGHIGMLKLESTFVECGKTFCMYLQITILVSTKKQSFYQTKINGNAKLTIKQIYVQKKLFASLTEERVSELITLKTH